MICELCLGATHQTCYGGPLAKKIPNGSWFCDRCVELKKNPGIKCTEIKCFLCPDIDGTMKKVTKYMWAHVVCVNWMPDIWFNNDKLKEGLAGEIDQTRFQISCNRCRRKEGACIQCDYQNCAKSYHVRCAARAGHIEAWETMQDDLGNPDECDNCPIFCSDHAAKGK